jgi:putative transposase
VPVAKGLKPRLPKLADLIDSRDEVLAQMAPQGALNRIYSTNPLGRLDGEIKRLTDVVTIFPNEVAILHLVGALLLERSDEWAVQRCHMSLETLETLSDDPRTMTTCIAAT